MLSMPKSFPIISKGFHPFAELIGFKFAKFKDGFSQIILDVEEKLFNPHSVLHGGVLYSMADTGMGGALYPCLNEDDSCATIEIKINYFKPVKSGKIICNTKLVHKGKNIAVLESKMLNDDELVAKAIGTYSIFSVRQK